MKRCKLIFIITLILLGLYSRNTSLKAQIAPNTTIKSLDFSTLKDQIHEGDIIFQTSLTAQSKAIQLATHSKYSHCGIIYKNNDSLYVFEAVQTVKSTPLDEWIVRGKDSSFVVKRLKNAKQVLTNEVILDMKKIGETYQGKKYDYFFEWSDDKMYCSELVWKIYKQTTGLEIGQLQMLKDFDLTNDEVQKLLKSRFGENIPLEEKIISPVGIFNSDLLMTVTEK